jgi:ubiquinone biosynthesis protein
MSAGTRNGVHNPSEFFLLTRAFVILESMIGQLAPDYNYMGSFRAEISRLTAKHFSLEQIKDKTFKVAREMERLISDAPGDARRILRHMAEGNLGRVQAPVLEALGGSITRNLERLARAIAFAALVVGGAMLLMTPMGGWHDTLGETMIIAGIVGMLITRIGVWLRNRARR